MGVTELGMIVGYDGSGTASDPSHGYSVSPPYTKFRNVNYPGAIDTVVTSAVSTRLLLKAGYYVDATQGGHTWGFIRNRGIWTQYKAPGTPKGPGSVNELLGINGTGIAVGFYTDSYGMDHPYELAGNRFEHLAPPNAVSAEATGITTLGDIVGNETTTSGLAEGWILRSGNYTTFSFPGSTATQCWGVNINDEAVGSYVDTSGDTHGYIVFHAPNPATRYWQNVDEPDAARGTTLTGLNAKHTFVGWYVDVNGANHGFVATLKGAPALK
jgi:hypothetical protein